MSKCPELAKEAVAELRADGIEPTLDDIAELIEAARKVEEPSRRTSPWFEGDPVRVGPNGPTLRPLSIQAEEWFDFAVSQFPDDKLRAAAFCYAAEHGATAGAFDVLWTRQTAETRLRRYMRGLACSPGALESAAARLMRNPSAGDIVRGRKESADAWDFGDVLAQLEAATGRPREYWMTQTARYAFRVLEHAIRHNMAGGAFTDAKADQEREYLRASFDFHAVTELIRERAANGRG